MLYTGARFAMPLPACLHGEQYIATFTVALALEEVQYMTHKFSSCPEPLCCGSASLQLLHMHAILFSVWLVTHKLCGLLADRLISKHMHAGFKGCAAHL